MIKVLRVSNHPTVEKHGIGLHCHEISETDAFETLFVSPIIDENDLFIKPKNYKLKYLNIKFDKRPLGVSFFKIVQFHISRIIKLIKFSRYAIQIARSNNVDIVHIHSPMYIIVAIWGKISRKKTCITYHGTDYLRVRNSNLYKFLSKSFLDIGFCISPIMINRMSSFHEHVVYSPNGVDSTVFIDNKKKRKKIILAVGSLKKEKSFDHLILAFDGIKHKLSSYSLHIVGEGNMRDSLQSLVDVRRLDDNVLLCGNLNKRELIEKYNESEVFVLSSKTEGFPKVVLEALFCGCKAISTNVGSVSTFLPEKYIIPDDSIANISNYLLSITKPDEYSVDLNELKVKYTWLKVIEIYANEYKNILKRSY
jgi:glycosyltransferase involved in cell wall biosynthesis